MRRMTIRWRRQRRASRSRTTIAARRSYPPRALLVVLATWLLTETARAAPILPEADASRREPRSREWLTIETGLRKLRETRLPALLWYAGSDPEAAAKEPFLEAYLRNSSFRRLVSRFVLVRLETSDLSVVYPQRKGPAAGAKDEEAPDRPGPARRGMKPDPGRAPARVPDVEQAAGPRRKEPEAAEPGEPKEAAEGGPEPAQRDAPVGDIPGRKEADPPTVAEVLKLPEGPAALLVLDFRERVVRRYPTEDPPRRSRLEADLKKVFVVNAYFVKSAAKVEKLLGEAERDFERGQVRKAVLRVLPLEGERERARIDPVLRERVDEQIQAYRKLAETIFERGRELEKDAMRRGAPKKGNQRAVAPHEKLKEAMDLYEEVIRDYPFPDLLKKAHQRRSIILSFLTGGSPLPVGPGGAP